MATVYASGERYQRRGCLNPRGTFTTNDVAILNRSLGNRGLLRYIVGNYALPLTRVRSPEQILNLEVQHAAAARGIL